MVSHLVVLGTALSSSARAISAVSHCAISTALIFLNYIYVDVHMSVGAYRIQKRVSYTLKLELQVVVNCSAWVLGMKSESSQEQCVLLTPEPFPQASPSNPPPLIITFFLGVSLVS